MLFCIPVETKSRDLDGRVLLARQLALEGHTCLLGRKNGVYGYTFKRQRPYVFVAKGPAIRIGQRIKETGGHLIVLDEEGGVFAKNMGGFASRTEDKMVGDVELYLAWGTRQKTFLEDERPNIAPDNIVVSGNPRFDLCAPKWHRYHNLVSTVSRSFKDGYFLINTKFANVNHQLGYEGRLAYTTKTIGQDPREAGLWTDDQEYQQEVFNYFLEAIAALAERFPQREIIIRPHPVEKIETYSEKFAHLSNVHAIRDGSVHEWIVRAGMIIQHDCTTGIEGMLFRRPTISYCPVLEEDLVQWLPVMAGYRVSTLADLIAIADEHVVRDFHPEHFIERYNYPLIKEFIHNTEGEALDIITKAITARCADWENDTPDHVTQEVSPALERGGRSRLGTALAAKIKSLKRLAKANRLDDAYKDGIQTLQRAKFDNLEITEIQTRLAAMAEITGGREEISVTPVGTDAYLIIRQ
jgi:surface carbohydrate biosynthesis protein